MALPGFLFCPCSCLVSWSANVVLIPDWGFMVSPIFLSFFRCSHGVCFPSLWNDFFSWSQSLSVPPSVFKMNVIELIISRVWIRQRFVDRITAFFRVSIDVASRVFKDKLSVTLRTGCPYIVTTDFAASSSSESVSMSFFSDCLQFWWVC